MVRKSTGSANETLDNGEECQAYTVEKILKTRKRGGRREYLIKWEGWPVDQSTWEAESDCDCEEAIKEFYENNGSQKDAKGKRKSLANGRASSSSNQEFRGARRATLEEIKGVVPEKKRRTISKEQPAHKSKVVATTTNDAKDESDAKPKQEPVSKPATPVKGKTPTTPKSAASAKVDTEERKPLSPVKDEPSAETPAAENGTKSSTRRSNEAKTSRSKRVADLRGSEISPARAGSYDSDEGSARIRFLRLKKKKEDVEVATSTDSSSTDDDRVYKVQQGHEIEKIVGVNREGSRLLYVVLYKGTSPKHQRMEYVPSRVLRSHAMETFVDFLEQLVIQSTASTEVTL